MGQFHLVSQYKPSGDQPEAIQGLVDGVNFGIREQINDALAAYKPVNNRSQLTETADNKLIVDAYNANPTSMMAALENFRDMKVDNKMVILGNMGELGGASWREHQKVVDFLVGESFRHVWLVGHGFKSLQHPFRTFDNVEQVKQALSIKKPKGYYILIKASHAMKLYEIGRASCRERVF